MNAYNKKKKKQLLGKQKIHNSLEEAELRLSVRACAFRSRALEVPGDTARVRSAWAVK